MDKLRGGNDLRNDPRYDFMVGHLVGQHRHLLVHMALYGDEKEREMAKRAQPTLAFFFDGPLEPLPELPPEIKATTRRSEP